MLDVRGLRVEYGAVTAVAGIDVRVEAGESVSLLGPNGAGKTSTLKAISGLVPSTGSITFDGVALRKERPEEIARFGVIQVPEGRHLFAPLTVHENLRVGTTARAGREATFELDEVYDLFPLLGPLRDRPAWALSGGEQQMVAIGRALVAAPRLLLLDEPSLGLAPIVANAVFSALAKVRREVPMLVVEQNTSLALSLSSRGYVLVNGEVVLDAAVEELADRQALLDAYLGQRLQEAAAEE